MIERRRGPRFSFKALQVLRIFGEFMREDFECHLTAETQVLGKVDVAHPARANLANYFVMSERSVGGNCSAQSFQALLGYYLARDYNSIRWRSPTGLLTGVRCSYFPSKSPVLRVAGFSIAYESITTGRDNAELSAQSPQRIEPC